MDRCKLTLYHVVEQELQRNLLVTVGDDAILHRSNITLPDGRDREED